ncbi:hypothetical protein [Methylomagnum sp.]
MDYYDLDAFKSALEAIESFFIEFAAKEAEILTYGMKRVSTWQSYMNAASLLPIFESKIYEFLAFLRPIDRQLYERAKHVAVESKLVESIALIQVSLRIESMKKGIFKSRDVFNFLFSVLPFSSITIERRKLFSEEVIAIQKILIELSRLINLVEISKSTYLSRWSHDSEVFKPSNLDNEKIIEMIESAITQIEDNVPISKDDKKQIVEYLYKAKSELSEKRPSWNKIVGALVIAAAITSGIADADSAYKKIDSAIKYILGTSITQHIQQTIPLLHAPHIPQEYEEHDLKLDSSLAS